MEFKRVKGKERGKGVMKVSDLGQLEVTLREDGGGDLKVKLREDIHRKYIWCNKSDY